MADNVPITAGVGTSVATDDISGVHFQRVKLVDGTLESTDVVPKVASPDIVITIDVTPDTSALIDGDVAFATQEVANAARINGGTMTLQSVVIADVDDQGAAIDLIFFDANTTLGAENSGPDIDDTEVQTIIGRVQVGQGAYYDLGANRVACIYGIGLLMQAGAATTSIYMAGITRTAATYAGGHLYIKLGFMRN